MPVEFRCSHCDKKLKVKDDLAGKKIKCPGCGEPTIVPAAKTPERGPPNVSEEESIKSLNLKKFRIKPIDPDEEDVNLEELEGAVVLRKKREAEALAKPPSQPLQPIDWILGLLCNVVAVVLAIVWIAKGQRSRGLKLLLLCLVMLVFQIAVAVLFIVAGVFTARKLSA